MMAVNVEQLLPRLLVGIGERPIAQLENHVAVHGPLPELRRWRPQELVALVDAAGLRGSRRGAFPMAER